jgi:ssDNA-binding Zn-finger/Zn-ribbon topoisomerase 1
MHFKVYINTLNIKVLRTCVHPNIIQKSIVIIEMINMLGEKKKYEEVECPRCHSKIAYLINKQDAIVDYEFYPDGNYSKEPEIEDEAGMDYNWWVCPECGEQITNKEKEALKFLRTWVLPKDYVKGVKYKFWKNNM